MNYDDRFTEGLLVGQGGYGNNGFFGNSGWEGIIGLIVVAGLFGGGFGGFGFGNRGGSPATQADLSAGFANSEIMSDLNDIILGQATMQNFINQGFAGLNQTVTTVGSNLSNAICTLGYQNQAGFNTIGNQIASCCCDIRQQISDTSCATQRAIDGVNYNMAKNTCDIIRANQDNTRAILDYLTGEKIASLQAENSGLKAQISNDRQSKYLIDVLGPKCPQPAFVVQPAQPVTFPTNCCGNVAYANYNGCGASVV